MLLAKNYHTMTLRNQEETPEDDAAVQELSDDDDAMELELERWRELWRGSRST